MSGRRSDSRVPGRSEHTADVCAIRQAPGGGQAGRSYIAVHIDAVAGLKNSVDPQGELAGLHVVRASGFDPQIGAGRPVGGNGRPDRCQGTLRHRLAGHRWVGHFAEALCLRLSLSLDERNQLGEENRIVNAVVNPAAPQYPVLRCPYQPTVSTGERASPVGEWYLIGSGPVPDPSVTTMNSMPTSPCGSSSRNPPALASSGSRPVPRYHGWAGSHDVSSSSLL